MCDYSKAVVIDNGAYLTKVGFAGEESPVAQFPTLVGKSKEEDNGKKDTYVGHDAVVKQDISLRCPLNKGTIWYWQDMESIWQHSFTKILQVPSSERPILLTDAPGSPDGNRQLLVRNLFEKFQAPAVCIVNQACLTLFATGRKTGLVLESGEDMTSVVAIVDGRIVEDSINSLPLGGRHLTKLMMQLVNDKGHEFSTMEEHNNIRDLKEKFCYVTMDYGKEYFTPIGEIQKTYSFPNGETISLDTERFQCPEALFKPSMVKVSGQGIHKLIHNSLMKCDENIREELLANVVLGGGSTQFPGLGERLKKEVETLTNSTEVNVIVSKDGGRSAWIGGAKEAASEFFQNRWITRHEYDEFGVSIVDKKYF